MRRNSLIGPSDLKIAPKKPIPDRAMPSTARPIPEEALHHSAAHAAEDHFPHGVIVPEAVEAHDAFEKVAAKIAPTFIEPTFDAPNSAGEHEYIVSPSGQALESTIS